MIDLMCPTIKAPCNAPRSAPNKVQNKVSYADAHNFARAWASRLAWALSAAAALCACGGGAPTAAPAAAAPASAPTAGTPPSSGKVFALMDPGESALSMNRYAALASVDGLAFRGLWGALESRQGSYEWSPLDAAMDAVRAQNKRLTLHVAVSGQAAPAWLSTAGVSYYSAQSPLGVVTGPLPWDRVYLRHITTFVAALAAHIRSRGDSDLVALVSDGAPVSEMTLVGCQNNLLGNAPYNRSVYLEAWRTTVTAYAQAFPATTLLISAPVPLICANDGDGNAFYSEVMNYALSQTSAVGIFAADLKASGTGSQRMEQVDASIKSRASVNFQTIWSATNDPTGRLQGSLDQAVCKGWSFGGRYFEIYKADIDNPSSTIQAAVARARAGPGC